MTTTTKKQADSPAVPKFVSSVHWTDQEWQKPIIESHTKISQTIRENKTQNKNLSTDQWGRLDKIEAKFLQAKKQNNMPAYRSLILHYTETAVELFSS